MTDLPFTSPLFHPGAAVRLPFLFDAAPLLAEASALSEVAWHMHFNTGYHDGGWSGVALLSPGGRADSLYLARDGADVQTVAPTHWAALCPKLMAGINAWPCTVQSARILRLAPGAVIREHRDDDLLWSHGVARIHVPLITHERVEFYVDQQRVVMTEGECWYLDLSRPHRVQNCGLTERIHLVLDCAVNDWLVTQVTLGLSAPEEPRAALAESSASQFARFREVVFADIQLQEQMREPDSLDALFTRAVTAGAALGFEFSVEDVRAQCNQSHRDWIEQWIM